MPMYSKVSALGLALLLPGCTMVGQTYMAPQPSLTASYGAVQAGGTKTVTAGTQWWKSFGDATLDKLIDAGLAQNLTVAQAVERVIAARETAAASGIDGLPSASVLASSTEAGSSAGAAGMTTNSASISASWEIDLFGGLARKREAATATIGAAVEEANMARLTLIGDIALAYVQARGYQDRLQIARTTLASQKKTLTLTQNQSAAGSGTALDVAQASGNVNTTAADIPTLETSLRTTIHSLSVLLGQEPSALVPLFDKGAQIPRVAGKLSPGLPADLVRDRPDVRQAERQLAAATAQIGVAEADMLPSFSLGGNLSLSGGVAAWTFGPSINVPIFNGGALKAAVNLEESKTRQQYLAYKAAVLGAVEEVENALVSFNKQKLRREQLAQSYTHFSKAVELSESLFQSGDTTLFEVLTAQRSLYSARDALAQSSVALATQYIALCKALGGGWDIRTGSTRLAEVSK